MLTLGIDSSCASAGAALIDGEKTIGRVTIADKRTHSVKLLPEIQTLIAENGLKPEDLELIAVNTGPGSFTGLRIGAATAKTMAFALEIPVAGVNTLDCIAAGITAAADAAAKSASDRCTLALIDARNLRTYACLYRGCDPVMPYMIDSIDAVMVKIDEYFGTKAVGSRVTVAGDAVLNEKICEVLSSSETVQYVIDREKAYPDPVLTAQLGLRQYIDAADKAAFRPEKLTLNYMKEW